MFIHIPTTSTYLITIWMLSSPHRTSASSIKSSNYASAVISWKSSYDQPLSHLFREWKGSKTIIAFKNYFPMARLVHLSGRTEAFLFMTWWDHEKKGNRSSLMTSGFASYSWVCGNSKQNREEHEEDCRMHRKIKPLFQLVQCFIVFPFGLLKVACEIVMRKAKKGLKNNLLKA